MITPWGFYFCGSESLFRSCVCLNHLDYVLLLHLSATELSYIATSLAAEFQWGEKLTGQTWKKFHYTHIISIFGWETISAELTIALQSIYRLCMPASTTDKSYHYIYCQKQWIKHKLFSNIDPENNVRVTWIKTGIIAAKLVQDCPFKISFYCIFNLLELG